MQQSLIFKTITLKNKRY